MIFTMTLSSQQYRLHGYMCGPDCVRWADLISTVTFEWIYLNRPEECRYAIAGEWSTQHHSEDVIVWDLFDATQVYARGGWKLVPPSPKLRLPDIDTAVMATSMLYDSED